MSLTRKEFLNSIVGVAAGAAGVSLLVGCSDSNSSTDAASAASCVNNGTSTEIGNNHGHVMMVSKADVAAGVDKMYDIMGTATHTHSVTITAQMFAMLKSNMTQMTISTNVNSHTHTITVMCV